MSNRQISDQSDITARVLYCLMMLNLAHFFVLGRLNGNDVREARNSIAQTVDAVHVMLIVKERWVFSGRVAFGCKPFRKLFCCLLVFVEIL